MYKIERTLGCKRTAQNIATSVDRQILNFVLILAFICSGTYSSIVANVPAFPFLEDVQISRQSTVTFLNALAFLEEECGDGIDNDNDGQTDCEDLDCGPRITNVSNSLPSGCTALDGSITISVIGGIPPYRYSINNGLSWQTNGGNYTNLANDTYIIRVQNADESCTANHSDVDLYNPDSPILDSVNITHPTICFLNDGTLNIYARGTGLEYSIDGGNTYSAQSNYTELAAGIYRVRVKKGECVISHPNKFIIEPECASNIVIPSGGTSQRCEWRLDESIALDIEGSIQPGTNLTYILTDLQGLILDVSSNASLSSLGEAGKYIAFILGVENGTTATGLSIDSYIQQVEIQSLCYEWSDGYIFEVCPTTETDCSDSFDNDGDGMTDCEDDDCSPIIMTMDSQDPTDCNVDNGSIVVSASGGQTQTYLYSIDFGQTWQSSPAFGNLGGGLYQVLVANSDESCPRVSPDIILQSPLPATILNVLSGNSTSCESPNGNITILASGTMTLLYSIDGGNTFQEGNQFTNIGGGSYAVRVKNFDGSCIVTQNDIILTDPVLPVINQVNADNPSLCGLTDGTITINATGNNIEYSINGGNTYTASNFFDNLGEGSYNVAVRNDDGSCRVLSSENPVVLTSGSVVDITDVAVEHASSCDGTTGQITITATGNSTLQYSINGGASFQASNIFPNLSGGNYNIVVSNSDGSCPESFPTINVIEESEGDIVNVNATNPTDCGLSNGSIVIIANEGSSNLEYRLDNGLWQSSNTFANLSAGTYTGSIRNVGGNCEVTGPDAAIIDPVAPEFVDINFTNVTQCDNDNGTIIIIATGTGGLEYSIDQGVSWSPDNVFSSLGIGDYSTAIRNADGSCMVTDEVVSIIEEISTVVLSLEKVDPACNGDLNGSVTSIVQGGVEPYSYDWSDNSNESFIDELGPGLYSLLVIDANGCTAEAEMLLIEPSELTSSATSQDDEQCNNCLNITASGGTEPYEYSADGENYQSGSTIAGVRGGTYTVYVKDASGCISTSEVELIDLNPLSCFINVLSTVSCNGQSDASVQVIEDEGEAPFLYSYDNVLFTSNNTFTNLGSGEHVFYISDNAGNNSTCSVILEEPNSINIISIETQVETCFDYADAIVDITASGGSGSLKYSMDGQTFQSSSVIDNVGAGTYNIVVKDDNECTASVEITVESASELLCSIVDVQQVSCFGNTDGGFVVLGAGGAGEFSYSLNGEMNNTGLFDNLSSGSYQVQVIDSKGCISTCLAEIEEPDQLACNIAEKSDVSCAGATDGSVQIGIEGGTLPITYELGNETNTTGAFNNLSGGSYNIIATDANGCVSNCNVEIIENGPITSEIVTSHNVTCFGEEDGSVHGVSEWRKWSVLLFFGWFTAQFQYSDGTRSWRLYLYGI